MTAIWDRKPHLLLLWLFLVPQQFPETSLEIWVLLYHMLHSRATEENNLVCLNEYSKSTVILGALNKTKVTLKNPVRPKPVENLQWKRRLSSSSPAATPGAGSRAERAESADRVYGRERPFQGPHHTSACGYFSDAACECKCWRIWHKAESWHRVPRDSAPSLPLQLAVVPCDFQVVQKQSYRHRLDAFLTQVHTEDWKNR